MLNMHAQTVPNMLKKGKQARVVPPYTGVQRNFPEWRAALAGLELQSLQPNLYAAVRTANPLGVDCTPTAPTVLNL